MTVNVCDVWVIRICDLFLRPDSTTESYRALVQASDIEAVNALKTMLGLPVGSSEDALLERVMNTDWLPLLKEREHLLSNTLLFQQLGYK